MAGHHAARTGQRRTDALRLMPGIVALALVLFLALTVLWSHHPADMSALYMAGRLWADGARDLIYATPDGVFGDTPPAWTPYLADWGMAGRETLAYIYPPMWAAALAPAAAALDPVAFFRTAALTEMALVAGSILLAWRLAHGFALPLRTWLPLSALLLGLSLPFYMAVILLQPQIAVIFLCLLAFALYLRGRSAPAGAVLALAATLKLAPAGLALIFLLDRNWRALGAFAAVAAAIGALGLAVAGIELHLTYLHLLSVAGEGAFVNAVNFSAEVLLHGLGSWLGLLPDIGADAGNVRILRTPFAVDAASHLLLALCLVWVIRATSGLEHRRRVVARLFLLSMLINQFGPLGWAHYFLLHTLLLPALIGLVSTPRRGAAILVAAAVATSWPLALGLAHAGAGTVERAAFGGGVMLALFAAVTASLGGARRRSEDTATKAAPPLPQ